MLILNEDEVKSLLTMDTCISAVEEAYRLYEFGQAVTVPRNELEIGSSGDFSQENPTLIQSRSKVYPMVQHAARGVPGPYFFSLKTMSGAVPKGEQFPFGCAALRLNADILANTRSIDGSLRRQQIPAAPGGRFCGQVYLWKTENGEPICMMPDSYIEAMRVGATNAVAAKYLAVAGDCVYGLIGSGLQAETQLQGMSQVRSLKKVKVWSPTREHREAFAAKWSSVLGLDIVPVATPEEAFLDSEIIGSATNSMEPIFYDMKLLQKGQFITTGNTFNMSEAFFNACDIKVVHNNRVAWPLDRTKLFFTPKEARRFITYWVTDEVASTDPLLQTFQGVWLNAVETEQMPWLGTVIVGKVKRDSADQTACFINNVGLGLQFAAVGLKVYESAVRRGVGHEVPTEWFTEEIQG